ncbi:hypothetical protein RHMOL_Rhmol10G0109100 [Rhododendron molle]|uniref:Uncharacterized protein n=1 Tax=Rhododendron molle TaxID=49168 RepID=A0ACC0M186_RHOML|nr:hypothetical protein RHMOL_Rhmol10G0109100 [Rhododendron molle]
MADLRTGADLTVANDARVLCRVVLDRGSRDLLNLPRADFSRVIQTVLTTREAELAAQNDNGISVVVFDPAGRRYSVGLRYLGDRYRFEGSDWLTLLGRNRITEGSLVTLWWSRKEVPGSNWMTRLHLYVAVARNAARVMHRCRCNDCGKDLQL